MLYNNDDDDILQHSKSVVCWKYARWDTRDLIGMEVTGSGELNRNENDMASTAGIRN